MTTAVLRQPVKVQRKPINVLSKQGFTKWGGWMVFNRPDEQPPEYAVKRKQRVLWCPYCGEWTVWNPRTDDQGVWDCLGVCGWVTTKDFYVRTANNMWWEDVPLEAMRSALRK